MDKIVKHEFENRPKLADKANSASFQEACAGRDLEGTYCFYFGYFEEFKCVVLLVFDEFSYLASIGGNTFSPEILLTAKIQNI